MESELFGHERGAFTGAERKRIGKLEQCSGGTLFLDEIGDMSPVLQSKLLRVLQEKQIERVGGNETITTDVRVIAATNRNLERMVSEGEFRSDLYYRLNGFSIHLPPLRGRGKDLDLLVEYFRRQSNEELGKQVREVSPEAMQVLRDYSWPGNIRELQNAVRQAILKTTGPVLLPDFLPDFVREDTYPEPQLGGEPTTNGSLDQLIEKTLDADTSQVYDNVISQVEERLVSRVVQRTGGDKAQAVRLLGINPAQLRSKAALELLNLELPPDDDAPQPIRPGMTMAEIEKEAIRRALEQTNGCRKEAAELLGISTRTMQRRVKELELD